MDRKTLLEMLRQEIFFARRRVCEVSGATPLDAYPRFITLKFHERPGALGEFLREISPHANLCYFNYVYSGGRVARALLGFEFNSQHGHDAFTGHLDNAAAYRDYEVVGTKALERML